MTWSDKNFVPDDAFDTLTPLYRLLNIFSLTSIYRQNKSLKVSYSKLKRILVIISLTCITIIVSTFKIMHYKKFYDPVTMKSIKFTDSIHMTYIVEFCHFLLSFYFVFKYGGEMSLKYFELYEQIDKDIGMAYNAVVRSKIARITAFSCFVSISTSVLEFIAWYHSYGWFVPTLYSVEYLFFFLNSLIFIEMTANVIQVEYRLQTIGDILQNYYNVNTPKSDLNSIVSQNGWIDGISKSNKINPKASKAIDYNYYDIIVSLNRCYLLLLEQKSFINKMFGFRVLVNNGYLLLCMVNTVNLAVRIARDTIILPDHSYLPAVTSLIRTFNSVLIIVTLVHQCERSYAQSERIVNIIDHILVDQNIYTSTKDVLTETRSLVLTRPIHFDAMKFYKLDYHLLDSGLSVVVTLSVILFQNIP